MEDKNSLRSSCWNLSVLMSELYNVSTPDNLALAIFGRERISFVAFGYGTVASSAVPASAR